MSPYGPYYPDDMTGPMVCIAEGCLSANCSRCGQVNYRELGYMGYVGRMAKKWGVSKDEALERICIESARKEEAREVGRVYS